MAFGAKGLTNKGRTLQAKAQAGSELKYTKFVMGDGVLGNQSITTLSSVIAPKKTVTATRVFVVPSDQRANVGMYFTNADVTTGFVWREIGLYAIDPDEGEILYWYGYDTNGTEIPAGGGSEILEQTFDTLVFVGTAQNVSSTVDASLVFASITQLNQFLADSKAYTDSKVSSATIPDATLTVKGKVQLTNAIDSISQTIAVTAKGVNDARQAAIAEAADDATNKVAAHSNQTTDIHGAVSAATPNKLVIRDANGRAQIASPNAAADIARLDTVTGQVGTLSSLLTTTKTNAVAAINELFQSVVNGKNGIAAAIIDMGGVSSGGDSFAQQAAAIRALPVTGYYETTLPAFGLGGEVALQLPFAPRAIVIRSNWASSSTQSYLFMIGFPGVMFTTSLTEDVISLLDGNNRAVLSGQNPRNVTYIPPKLIVKASSSVSFSGALFQAWE